MNFLKPNLLKATLFIFLGLLIVSMSFIFSLYIFDSMNFDAPHYCEGKSGFICEEGIIRMQKVVSFIFLYQVQFYFFY